MMNVISKLSNKEIAELVQNLSNGVPIATPVFDGASTEDITKMLDLAKLTKFRSNSFMEWSNRRKI